ncbi:MAG: 4Fe-4S binding protein [Pirellulales bacterium]|nr:4Fe-4S binding protein [Pirellulales bacterium]
MRHVFSKPTFYLFAIVLLAMIAGSAYGVERFPPPDFSDHQLPAGHTPERTTVWYYMHTAGVIFDIAMLTAMLAGATYFAHFRRSRRGLFVLAIVALAYFGFWREGCICAIGSIQNVSLALFDPDYAIPLLAVAFFVLPLVFTLFVGRTFCAAVCPLGAIQELVAVRSVKVPAWLDQTLGLFRYIYLGLGVALAATGTAFVICRYDPFVGFFRMSAGIDMLVFGGALILLGVFVGRPYCRYLCPYGAILSPLARLSKFRVRVTPDDCIGCRLCEDVCPYGAIRPPTVDQPPETRPAGRRRLAVLIVLLPLLVCGGAFVGSQLSESAAKLHPTVRLSERLSAERLGLVEGTDDASDAFRNTGRAESKLYEEAEQKRGQIRIATALFGGWVGLVIGIKLLQLSIRRRRTDYTADPSACFACGRCFKYCPNDPQSLVAFGETTEAGGAP